MRKIIFILIVISTLLSGSVFAANDFDLGKAAFAKKDYKHANYYFVQYLTKNPNDANARYYYAQTLTYLRNYNQARTEYGYVMQLAPGTMVANYAKASLFFLDKTLANNQDNKEILKGANSGNTENTEKTTAEEISKTENYLSKSISSEGEINTWDSEKMPIKVYIDMSNRPKSAYVQALKSSLATWQAVSAGLISFQYVSDISMANVTVQIKGTPPKTDKYSLGLTKTHTHEGYIKSAEMILYYLDSNYKALSVNDFYNVALHEGGHLVGISGHSTQKEDIMFPTYDKAGASAVQMHLSPRDISTFKAMYAIDKNPYATGVNSLNKILGSKEERLNSKLQDELEYAKNFPNKPLSYNNVAYTYELQNKDAEAIEYYKKALALDPMDTRANTRLANMYGRINDLKNAEVYYKKLISANPKSKDAYCDLTNLYIKNNKLQLAKSTMNSLLYRNPAVKNDARVKTIMQKLNPDKQ